MVKHRITTDGCCTRLTTYKIIIITNSLFDIKVRSRLAVPSSVRELKICPYIMSVTCALVNKQYFIVPLYRRSSCRHIRQRWLADIKHLFDIPSRTEVKKNQSIQDEKRKNTIGNNNDNIKQITTTITTCTFFFFFT